MLCSYFYERPRKEALPAQPFIDNRRQRILVASRGCYALKLLWCHIGYSARDSLEPITGTLDNHCKSKITEQNCILVTEQHVFWFHIPMDEFSVMCIL